MRYLVERYIFLYNYAVAPLVGAWIEMHMMDNLVLQKMVAPLVGVMLQKITLTNSLMCFLSG